MKNVKIRRKIAAFPFEGLNELDRRTVVNLIRSIRVVSKTELDFTFNYQAEYEQALHLLGLSKSAKEVA